MTTDRSSISSRSTRNSKAFGFLRRASIAIGLALALITVVLPTAAQANLSLSVTQWNVNYSTGEVTYDVTLNDVCNTSSCSWKIEARYVDGGTEFLQKTLGSGSVGGSSLNPNSYSKQVTAPATVLPEITHLKGVVTPSSGAERTTGLIRVSDPYPEGSIQLDIAKWDADKQTGWVSYDLTMKIVGAKQVNAPCTSRCFYKVEAWYKDGSVEKQQHLLYSYDCLSGCWTVTKPLTDAFTASEVTHLRAHVRPSSSSCPDPCSRVYDTGLIPVSPPYPEGHISLDVRKWSRPAGSSNVSFDLVMQFVGAKQEGGPCTSRCYYYTEAWYKDGSVERKEHTLHNYDCLSSCWTVTKQITDESFSARPVTHLRAYVRPSTSSCPAPCARVYDTGLLFVGDSMVNGEDLVSYEAALEAALLADASTFCARLAVEGSGLPSTNGTSPSDAWEACETAIQLHGPVIRKVLLAIAAAAGGGLALHMLLDEHANEGPIPTEEEEATPLPWFPPPDWDDEDNDCHWESIQYTADSERHLREKGHLYEYRKPGKSYFYPWVKVIPLAETYALRQPPVPDSGNPSNCRRVLTYDERDVGIDRNTARTTSTFTVVTDKGTGNVVTMFPGTND